MGQQESHFFTRAPARTRRFFHRTSTDPFPPTPYSPIASVGTGSTHDGGKKARAFLDLHPFYCNVDSMKTTPHPTSERRMRPLTGNRLHSTFLSGRSTPSGCAHANRNYTTIFAPTPVRQKTCLRWNTAGRRRSTTSKTKPETDWRASPCGWDVGKGSPVHSSRS